MASAARYNQLLKDATNFQIDQRFMAISDLTTELQKDAALDVTMEKRICGAILERLQIDKSSDVQAASVKCLSVLMKRAQEEQVSDVCTKLCERLVDARAQSRDVVTIGLKTLIAEAADSSAPVLTARLLPGLLRGVANDNVDVQMDSLDVLGDLLKRFSQHAGAYSRGSSLRKRASGCLARLAISLPDAELTALMTTLMGSIRKPGAGKNTQTLIQTIGSLARQVGWRLSSAIGTIIPLLLDVIGDPDDESAQTDAHNELRENALQALESLVLRCPAQVSEFVSRIIGKVMVFISYDPNYSYDDIADEDGGEEYDDAYDNDGDDDDTSWKVRRAAVKVLSAVIRTRPELLHYVYENCASELIDRFKEREDSVKIDIINAFVDLLHATLVIDDSIVDDLTASSISLPAAPVLRRQRSSVSHLHERLDLLVNTVNRQLQSRKTTTQSIKNKQALFNLCSQLCMVVGDAISGYAPQLLSPAIVHLADKSSALKLDALQFIRAFLEASPAGAVAPYLAKLIPAVVAVSQDSWYKIVAESMRVIGRVAPVIAETGQTSAYGAALAGAVLPRLSAHDVDQEIKECAIIAIGHLLAALGSDGASFGSKVLSLLMERMRNEITRGIALRAIGTIASAAHAVDLRPVIDPLLAELQSFLRQQSRTLRQNTLETLIVLVTRHRSNVPVSALQSILSEASYLISDDDVQLASLTLQFVLAVHQHYGDLSLVNLVLNSCLNLASSPLLQGHVLEDLLKVFHVACASNDNTAQFNSIVERLHKRAQESSRLQRQQVSNIAMCVAAACTSAPPPAVATTVRQFLNSLQGVEDNVLLLNLLCLGEIGKVLNVSAIESNVLTLIGAAFSHPSVDVKQAAAIALGGICVGSPSEGVPLLLSRLRTARDSTYLLLLALREFLSRRSAQLLPASDISTILDILVAESSAGDEGIRNMVAECLGKLAFFQAATVLERLVGLMSSSTAFARWTAVTALKYAVASTGAREHLEGHLASFLRSLYDPDLSTRRAALLTLNAIIHHCPRLVLPLLIGSNDAAAAEETKAGGEADLATVGVFPVLYYEMLPRADLVREVDLGPFKHKEDDGLDLRKAAFACIDSILDRAGDRVSVAAFFPCLHSGLNDHDDIKMLCHQLLCKMCEMARWRRHVMSDVPELSDCFEKTLKKFLTPKSESKVTEVIRSALRAVDAVNRLPDVQVPRFTELVARLQGNDMAGPVLAAIRAEQGPSGSEVRTSGGAAGFATGD